MEFCYSELKLCKWLAVIRRPYTYVCTVTTIHRFDCICLVLISVYAYVFVYITLLADTWHATASNYIMYLIGATFALCWSGPSLERENSEETLRDTRIDKRQDGYSLAYDWEAFKQTLQLCTS